jgi:hypothetical protein
MDGVFHGSFYALLAGLVALDPFDPPVSNSDV